MRDLSSPKGIQSARPVLEGEGFPKVTLEIRMCMLSSFLFFKFFFFFDYSGHFVFSYKLYQ